ncbi:MAG: hypothetical protein SF187_21195 [Deltaproteobacteria bacterium]|nr:hypothetical protein [Deltaproteobacteria bacterium]
MTALSGVVRDLRSALAPRAAVGRLAQLARRPGPDFIILAALLVGAKALVGSPVLTAWRSVDVFTSPFLLWRLIVVNAEWLRLLFPHAVLLVLGVRPRWESWESGQRLRVVIMVLSTAVAWSAATYSYNEYFGHGHWLDRALVLILAGIGWKRPMAVPYLTMLASVLLQQAGHPIGVDSFDWRPILEVMCLFSCFVWLAFLPNLNTRHFVLVALALIGTYYFEAGIAKIRFRPVGSWVFEDDLSNLLIAAHMRGWLSFIPDAWIYAVAHPLRALSPVLTVFTVVTELGFLLLFMHRRLTRPFLLMAAALHVGIFLLAGIFFWKWVLLNLLWFWFFKADQADVRKSWFDHRLTAAFAVVLAVFGGRQYFRPQIGVAWWDTNFNELYEINAIGKSGASYRVAPDEFAPNDVTLVQANYWKLVNGPSLMNVYGSAYNHDLYVALKKATSLDEIPPIYRRFAQNRYNEGWQKSFDELMRRNFRSWNQHGFRHRWLRWIGRPPHLWVFPRNAVAKLPETIVRVDITRQPVLFSSDAVQRGSRDVIHSIKID